MGSQGLEAAAPPLRLAILMADTPLPQTQAAFQTYGGVFTDLFTRAVAPAPLESQIAISLHDIVSDGFEAAYPDLDAVDAVLVTGSRYNAFDHTPWIEALVAYTRRVLATTAPDAPATTHPVKFVGVCFGHQILGRALDCPVDRSPGGWEVSVTPMKLTPTGQQLFGRESLNLHEMHRDAVLALPPGALPLAETAACPIQGFALPGRAISVQGHPEFTGPIVRELLESRHDMGILSDDIYAPAIAVVDNKHDGEATARGFLTFLRGEA